MLHYLYTHRCLSVKGSKRVEAIHRDLGEKLDVDDVLKSLLNARLIGRTKKKSYNYWAKAGVVIRLLREHNYPISKGGKIPL